MNPELFFEAMGEVDDTFYQEAQVYRQGPRRWGKFAWIAACAAVVCSVSLAPLRPGLPGQEAPLAQTGPPAASVPTPFAGESAPVPPVSVNEITAPHAVIHNIALLWEDYVPTTYEELLEYFYVSLPVPEVLPHLTLQEHDFGIFRSPERGAYFDGNGVVFANADGSEQFRIGLGKVFLHVYDVFELTEDELTFTDINGRKLALFHYTSEEGADCYYTEFLQGDVAFTVGSEAISVGEYLRCLEALVDPVPSDTGPAHSLTGEVDAIDPYANRIGLLVDEENGRQRGYGVNLPAEWSAAEYSLGETLTVTYTGEPATICTIWPGQLIAVTRLP